MAGNTNLKLAKKNKNDEFYTRLEDIAKELCNYKKHFENKVVLCNCDDPFESNFFRYFMLNYREFNLKGLIATCYSGSCIANQQLSLFPEEDDENKTTRQAYSIVLLPEHLEEYEFIDEDIIKEVLEKKHLVNKLKGNGDFASEECLEFLKQADIVVTNPPFSLFRKFIDTLLQYNKKFVVLGNPNAITYKDFFPKLQNNEVWIGYKSMGSDMYFIVSEDHALELQKNKKEGSGYVIIDGNIYGRAQAIWFTNLDIPKRHISLVDELRYQYEKHPEWYPKYDNYDAINIGYAGTDAKLQRQTNRVDHIPYDYFGVMGVPITFLDRYNPDEFEIVKFRKGDDDKDLCVSGKSPYFRILIKRKENNS